MKSLNPLLTMHIGGRPANELEEIRIDRIVAFAAGVLQSGNIKHLDVPASTCLV